MQIGRCAANTHNLQLLQSLDHTPPPIPYIADGHHIQPFKGMRVFDFSEVCFKKLAASLQRKQYD